MTLLLTTPIPTTLIPIILIHMTPIYIIPAKPTTPKTLPLPLTPKAPQQLPLYYMKLEVSPSPITLLLL